MKLLSKLNRQIGDVRYTTWYVQLNVGMVEELGWVRGQDLEAAVDGDTLIIRPRSLPQNAPAVKRGRKANKIDPNNTSDNA